MPDMEVRHDGVTERPRDDGPVMQENNRTAGDETVSVLVIVLDEAVPGRFVLRNPRLDCVVEEYVLFASQAVRLQSLPGRFVSQTVHRHLGIDEGEGGNDVALQHCVHVCRDGEEDRMGDPGGRVQRVGVLC